MVSQIDIQEGLRMLDTFTSVGAETFSITHVHLTGEKRGFRPRQSAKDARRSLPYLLTNAPARQNNVIIRPEPFTRFIQLDDITAEAIERVRPAAFLIVATSPGNYQAWLSVADLAAAEHKEYSRRLRRGAGGDLTASGAVRVAGSLNFKPKYAPAFPRVSVLEAAPGRTTTKAELEALGLVAAPEIAPAYQPPRHVSPRRLGARKWPSYARTLAGAPAAAHNNNQADRSRADFTWCLTALDWGFSPEATAAQLLRESEKARQQGPEYARHTADQAAEALARRGQLRRQFQTPQI